MLKISAPGKTILMGEHAAVYGHPALVAAIDRRLHVTLEPAPAAGLYLDLPQVDVAEQCTYAELQAYAAQTAEAWRRYRDAPSPESFQAVQGTDPAHLVKVAVGETLAWLRRSTSGAAVTDAAADAWPGMRLHLHSDIPLGAGFGSSAAASVAVVVALLRQRGLALEFDDLHALTLDVERRQHGMPSGIDNATVLHGGLVWATRRDDGSLHTEPLAATASWLQQVRIFNSGRPAQTTGDVVAAVRRLRQDDRRRFDDAMETMVEATHQLRRALLDGGNDGHAVVHCFRRFQSGLESLGVVPAEIRQRVRRIEEAGGAAKISGAGALAGAGAGSLLVFHPEPETIDQWRFLDTLEPLSTTLGAPGVLDARRSPPDRI